MGGCTAKEAAAKKYDISGSILQSWLISKFSESLMGPPSVVSEDFSQTEKMTALEKDILNGSCVFSCQRITISKPEENTLLTLMC